MNEHSLGDICTLHYGKALRGYSAERLSELSARVYGTNGPIGWAQEPLSIAPTIIIGRKGAYRGVHYSEIPSWTIDTAYFLTLNDDQFDLRWLYYRLLLVDINGMNSGAAIPSTKREDFYSIRVGVPSLTEQKRIADILSAYDDLIENNRRRIKLLEEAARQLYREWFVRLRFPGHEHIKIVDGVPEGWYRRPLGELCDRITDGSHWSPKGVDDGMPMASVKDMHEWDFDVDTCRQISDDDYRQLVANDCRPRLNDILVAKDGANLNKHTFLIGEERDLVILSSIAIIRPLASVNSEFLTAMLKSDVVNQALKNKVSGAAIPRIVLKDFRTLQLLVPPRSLQDAWEQSCGGSMQLCRKLTKINKRLANARDVLLPRLMDGRIAV